MAVTRFRSVTDMPAHPPAAATPLEGLQSACAMSSASRVFGHEALAPRGVRKFRSVAQASEYQQRWEESAAREAAAG